jgi:hypothetical protein
MIKLLVMDVDGTLTNGKIYMSNEGEIFKSFDIKRIANSVFGIEITESDYELLKDIALTCYTNKYNTHIRQTLIETEYLPISNGGYHHDNVLGICVCKECADKPKLDLYGKILMEIRSELKNTEN